MFLITIEHAIDAGPDGQTFVERVQLAEPTSGVAAMSDANAKPQRGRRPAR